MHGRTSWPRTRVHRVPQAGVRRGGDRDHEGAARRAPRAAHRRLDADGGRERRGYGVPVRPVGVSPFRRRRGRHLSARARGWRACRSASRRTARMASGPASSRHAMGNNWYIGAACADRPCRRGCGRSRRICIPRARRPTSNSSRARSAQSRTRGTSAPEGRVMHAQVRMGNAVLEMGESGPAASPCRQRSISMSTTPTRCITAPWRQARRRWRHPRTCSTAIAWPACRIRPARIWYIARPAQSS